MNVRKNVERRKRKRIANSFSKEEFSCETRAYSEMWYVSKVSKERERKGSLAVVAITQ